MAMQMQAFLATPSTGLASGTRTTRVCLPIGFAPRLAKRVNLRVKCLANDGESEVKAESPTAPTPSPAVSSPSPTPSPNPQPKKASTNLLDVFAFSGPGPERINGRLAMIGFVAAIAMEVSKGSDLFSQISNGGTEWFLGTSILFTVASLVPLFRGESVESKTNGLMNSNAELWNGRFAMLGLIALAFTEFVKGGALV